MRDADLKEKDLTRPSPAKAGEGQRRALLNRRPVKTIVIPDLIGIHRRGARH